MFARFRTLNRPVSTCATTSMRFHSHSLIITQAMSNLPLRKRTRKWRSRVSQGCHHRFAAKISAGPHVFFVTWRGQQSPNSLSVPGAKGASVGGGGGQRSGTPSRPRWRIVGDDIYPGRKNGPFGRSTGLLLPWLLPALPPPVGLVGPVGFAAPLKVRTSLPGLPMPPLPATSSIWKSCSLIVPASGEGAFGVDPQHKAAERSADTNDIDCLQSYWLVVDQRSRRKAANRD